MAIVYKIENPLGQVYVGSTTRDALNPRKAEHKYNLKRGRRGLLYDSFNKFGFDNHKFSVITSVSKDDVIELEHFIIQEMESELNQVGEYNATHLGKRWVTNGLVEVSISPESDIPDGFYFGRKPNDKLGKRKQ